MFNWESKLSRYPVRVGLSEINRESEVRLVKSYLAAELKNLAATGPDAVI